MKSQSVPLDELAERAVTRYFKKWYKRKELSRLTIQNREFEALNQLKYGFVREFSTRGRFTVCLLTGNGKKFFGATKRNDPDKPNNTIAVNVAFTKACHYYLDDTFPMPCRN